MAQRVYRTKTGQPYVKDANGRPKFIPKNGAPRQRRAPANANDASPPRKKKRKKPDVATQAMRWVKRNPGTTALGVGAAVLGTALAIPRSRRAIAETASEAVVATADLLR